MTVILTAKFFKYYKFLSYKYFFPLATEISLTMTHPQKLDLGLNRSTEISGTMFHRNFWDYNVPQKFLFLQRSTEISRTVFHRNFWDYNDPQKFLGQCSTEISGTMFHRNFWDYNVPQKYLGQCSTGISGTTFQEISAAAIHRNF